MDGYIRRSIGESYPVASIALVTPGRTCTREYRKPGVTKTSGFFRFAGHVWQLEGGSPSSNLMEVKDSEAQGPRREAWSEGSVEQRCEPMDKNRIGGLRRWARGPMTSKPVSIKSAGGKFGGCASKANDLTPGGLAGVPESERRASRGVLTAGQKSAEGIVRECPGRPER